MGDLGLCTSAERGWNRTVGKCPGILRKALTGEMDTVTLFFVTVR